MSYARSPREVCSTTIGTRFKSRIVSIVSNLGADCSGSVSTCRAHGLTEGQRLRAHVSMLGDPFGNLVFEHPVLQAAHELGIALIEFNYPLRLLVGRGDRGERFGDAAVVDAYVVLTGQFTDQ